MEQEVPAVVRFVVLAAVVGFAVGIPLLILELALLKRFVPPVFSLGFPLLRARYRWPEGVRFAPGADHTTDHAVFRFLTPDRGVFRGRIEKVEGRRNREKVSSLGKGTLHLESGAVRIQVRYGGGPLLMLTLMATMLGVILATMLDATWTVRALLLVAAAAFVAAAGGHTLRTELRAARAMIRDLETLFPGFRAER